MLMKILFLDHDGVICLLNNFGSRSKKDGYFGTNSPIESRFDNFDRKAVKVLNSIIEETGCEIVVSSDWRIWATLDEMGEYYVLQGIIKKPISYTPRVLPSGLEYFHRNTNSEETRSYEIKEWLNEHPEVTHWVAVDDLNMSERYGDISRNLMWGLKNFVHTPLSLEGIKQTEIKEKIIKFLNP
jgi:hypothetical protein